MLFSPGRRVRTLLALLTATPLLAACGGPGDGAGTGPRVVASFYPLQYVTQRVAGENVEVESLASSAVDPHDLELTLQQTAAVADADLVVLSSGFQPAVDATVKENAEGRIVDAADVADMIPISEDAHAHAEEWTEEWEREHAEDPVDPHFWLDPTRLASVAAAVARELAEIDPDNAATYQANAADLEADLSALDSDIFEGLKNCERNTVVVSHNAFGYFAIHYGVHMRAINGISPEAGPSPAHLRELSDLVEEEGITTVFTETLASPELAETLASDLDLETAVLDPIEGLGEETADEDYISLMRANLAALRKANGCS